MEQNRKQELVDRVLDLVSGGGGAAQDGYVCPKCKGGARLEAYTFRNGQKGYRCTECSHCFVVNGGELTPAGDQVIISR